VTDKYSDYTETQQDAWNETYIFNNASKNRRQFPRPIILTYDDYRIGRNM
jgi:hypothetical protein